MGPNLKKAPLARLFGYILDFLVKADLEKETSSIAFTAPDIAEYVQEKFQLPLKAAEVDKFLRGNTKDPPEQEKFREVLKKWGIFRVDSPVPEKYTYCKKRSNFFVLVGGTDEEPPEDVKLFKSNLLEKFRDYHFPIPLPISLKTKAASTFPPKLWVECKISPHWPLTWNYKEPTKSIEANSSKATRVENGGGTLTTISPSGTITLDVISPDADAQFTEYFKLHEKHVMTKNAKSPGTVEMKSYSGHTVKYLRLPTRRGDSKSTDSRKKSDYLEYMSSVSDKDRLLFIRTVINSFPEEFEQCANKKGFVKLKKLSIEKTKQFIVDYSLSATKVRKISTFLSKELGCSIFPCHRKIYEAVKEEENQPVGIAHGHIPMSQPPEQGEFI